MRERRNRLLEIPYGEDRIHEDRAWVRHGVIASIDNVAVVDSRAQASSRPRGEPRRHPHGTRLGSASRLHLAVHPGEEHGAEDGDDDVVNQSAREAETE